MFNWVKAQRQGRLKGVDSSKAGSAEQIENQPLRAELARVKMERDIREKRRRTS
jgi:transposase